MKLLTTVCAILLSFSVQALAADTEQQPSQMGTSQSNVPNAAQTDKSGTQSRDAGKEREGQMNKLSGEDRNRLEGAHAGDSSDQPGVGKADSAKMKQSTHSGSEGK